MSTDPSDMDAPSDTPSDMDALFEAFGLGRLKAPVKYSPYEGPHQLEGGDLLDLLVAVAFDVTPELIIRAWGLDPDDGAMFLKPLFDGATHTQAEQILEELDAPEFYDYARAAEDAINGFTHEAVTKGRAYADVAQDPKFEDLRKKRDAAYEAYLRRRT
jgi:hypothetical protein